MASLDALLPEYRAQYESLMPEIERKLRGDLVRRGMSYSGEAGDALARAQAKLLAELAGKSADTRAGQEESTRQRQFAAEQAEANRREQARAQRLGLVSSAVGGLGTLGAMYMMRPGAGANINVVPLGPGQYGQFDPASGTIRPIPMQGMEGGITAPGGGVMASGASPAAAATPSMWQRAGGFSGLAAGAGGGLLGSRLAALSAGRQNQQSDIGAGLGGLTGMAAAMRYGGGSPWAAGLGALAGSFGGGLLGNLFK